MSMAKSLYLPDVAGNHISVPDHASYTPAADFVVRWDVAVGDYSDALQTILSHWATGGDNRQLFLHTDLDVATATDPVWVFDMGDTDGTFKEAWYSEPHGLANGDRAQFKAVYDGDDGASGRSLTYYQRVGIHELTSEVGWSVLNIVPGGTATRSGTFTSFKDAATGMYIGANNNGSGNLIGGKIYRVMYEVDGTVVFDANFKDLSAGEVTAGEFTEDSVTAATVTIAGSAWSYDADSVTAPTGGYLYLPAASGEQLSVVDSAALQPGNILDTRIRVNLATLPSGNHNLAQRWPNSYQILLRDNSGFDDLQIGWYTDAGVLTWKDSSPLGLAAAQDVWFRVTLDATSDPTVGSFYYSLTDTNDDAEAVWTEINPFSAAGVSTIRSSGTPATLISSGSNVASNLYRALIYNDGVNELDIDLSDLTAAEVAAASFTEDSSNAATVTINGTAWSYVGLSSKRRNLAGPGQLLQTGG